MKNLLLISALQFVFGLVFSQEPDKAPAPPVRSEKAPEVIYDIVDEPAEFPGGMGALKEYIKANLKYPETARANGIEGKCYLQFIVKADGYISNVKVKKGVTDCPECDQEAIRLVKNMPQWKPGKTKGENANSNFTLPVTFKP